MRKRCVRKVKNWLRKKEFILMRFQQREKLMKDEILLERIRKDDEKYLRRKKYQSRQEEKASNNRNSG